MIQALAKTFLRYMSLLIVIVSLNQNTAKADSITDVVNAIMTLTCETEGIGDLLTKPFTHTCIQDPFSTLIVANIISPGIYASMMLRLRIDDDNIFPGNCLRKNRANPANPTLNFGLCTNYLMIAYRAEMIGKFASSLVNGAPSWDSLANMIDSSKYTQLFHNKHDGDWGIYGDIPLGPVSPVFPWKVIVHGDRICVETISFIGWMHVGCKYIAEPFPKSVYGSFFHNDSDPSHVPSDMADYLDCATSGGCAYRAEAASKAPISISATIMECIREMLTKLLISKNVCNIGSVHQGDSIDRTSSVFYQFQVNMHRTVMALLTLYVMFIGFKILLAGEAIPKTGELVMYVLKLVLVIYFSVGININGGSTRFDGMTTLVFPLLMGAASEISVWVMNATPSGLCKFLPSEYPADLGYLSLWDALDCKVIHYIGIDAIMTAFQGQNSGDPLGYSIPPYVFLLIPALYFKQINLVILALSYPLVVMSLAAYLVNSFAVCMIAITILGILAPLYVPMALFQQTKGYFEGWYTLMISFVLQPVVVIGFMTLMFALYDMGFYGTCKYIPMTMKKYDANGEVRNKKLFIIDNAKSHYESEADYASCQESIGWILNNPLGALAARIGRESQDGTTVDMNSTPEAEKKLADYIGEFGALSGITPVMGFFLGYFTLLSQLSWSMIVNLMTCCLLLYLMYELSSQLGEFASDIAQSVTLSGVVAPRGLSDKAMAGLEMAGKAWKGGGAGGGAKPAPSMGGAGGGGGSSGGGTSGSSTRDGSGGGPSPTSGDAGGGDVGTGPKHSGAVPPQRDAPSATDAPSKDGGDGNKGLSKRLRGSEGESDA